jgi:hypothetical protein
VPSRHQKPAWRILTLKSSDSLRIDREHLRELAI